MARGKAAGERPDDALLQTAVRIIDATWASHLVHSGTHVPEMGEAISLPVGNLYQGAGRRRPPVQGR